MTPKWIRNCKEAGCARYREHLDYFIGPVCKMPGGVFAAIENAPEGQLIYCVCFEEAKNESEAEE